MEKFREPSTKEVNLSGCVFAKEDIVVCNKVGDSHWAARRPGAWFLYRSCTNLAHSVKCYPHFLSWDLCRVIEPALIFCRLLVASESFSQGLYNTFHMAGREASVCLPWVQRYLVVRDGVNCCRWSLCLSVQLSLPRWVVCGAHKGKWENPFIGCSIPH